MKHPVVAHGVARRLPDAGAVKPYRPGTAGQPPAITASGMV